MSDFQEGKALTRVSLHRNGEQIAHEISISEEKARAIFELLDIETHNFVGLEIPAIVARVKEYSHA